MTTIFYPDISGFDAGISTKGALAVCCKVTEGTTYVNPDYDRAKADAVKTGTFFFAYHFLHEGNAISQARWAYAHAGKVPLMLDIEPTSGQDKADRSDVALELSATSVPQLGDVEQFVNEYRRLGGIVHLAYLPWWYWSAAWVDASLRPLQDLHLYLVSSQYTLYSASGDGWRAYGGMSPLIWQYTDTVNFNGFTVDFNAFKGTVDELKSYVETGKPADAPARKHAVNPVIGLKVDARTTQADVSWDKATGAKSYRVILWHGRKRLVVREGKDNGGYFKDLNAGTDYRITVLALPATLWATVMGRASKSFTTK